MKFLSAERISTNKYKTPEGYLVCVDSILARTGKQTYRKNEIFDCNDTSEISVDRRPEEVFSEMTLASFENKPLTIEHPDEDVNTSNFRDLAVGFVRDIRRGKDNGQDVMLGTLVITDAQAIDDVESGHYKELSCGYDCDIDDSANPQQKNIRGNHIALCEQGRAGIARIVDSVKDEKTFKIGWVRRSNDRTEYTDVPANSEKEAEKKLRARYVGEVYRIFECKKINDSEELEMKDKLIDIPSDVLGKIESLFKARSIKVVNKGKTWTGRVHYQVEFAGKAIDLKKKLDLIEKQVETFDIPMTYAIGRNTDDTLATAGVDFDKQHVDDSIDDESYQMGQYTIIITSSKVLVKKNGKYAKETFENDKEAELAIKENRITFDSIDDNDLITKAINDEVTAIELYNRILADDIDNETRAIIEEIRDDENDHLVKLTKLKNKSSSKNETTNDEDSNVKDSHFKIVAVKAGKRFYYNAKNNTFSSNEKEATKYSEQDVARADWSEIMKSNKHSFDRIFVPVFDSEETVEDATMTFEIRWIDTYKKSKGYGKEEYLHVDKVKANTLSEALKKLADNVALAGIGTANALIVSIHSDKASYMYSGKLSELVRKVKDSSKIEKAINVIRAMRKR